MCLSLFLERLECLLHDAQLKPCPKLFVVFFTFRETLGNLDRSKLQLLALSSAGVGALLCYLVWKQSPKTIPMGDGWWGAGEKPLTEDKTIHGFVVKTSVEEIEVGAQPLEQ